LETSLPHKIDDGVGKESTVPPVIAFSSTQECDATHTLLSDRHKQVQRKDEEPLHSRSDVELDDSCASGNSWGSTRRFENHDLMSRLQITSYRPRRHCFEHLLEASEELANVWLRRHVTIPAELELSGRANAWIDSAERLPSVTCAFKGCTGCEQPTKKFVDSSRYQTDCPSDRQLRVHVLETHNQLKLVALPMLMKANFGMFTSRLLLFRNDKVFR
jgi:hypothetical protein